MCSCLTSPQVMLRLLGSPLREPLININLSTVNILVQVSLAVQDCLELCRMVSSIPSLYQLDASSSVLPSTDFVWWKKLIKVIIMLDSVYKLC